MAIQMNVSGIRRNLKNIAHNYTDAQVKVREATSNDPWGPSSTLMSEIADLTYNVVAFSEIMQMIWKRLNDHGRNWRHVYKALVLLEYLIKTGSEKIADQCKENIFAIQTLKDFQYLEENKDMGINVREKAKALVALLKDDERLRNERVRALKAKERFAQSVSAIGSDSDLNSPTSPSYTDTYVTSSSRPTREPFGVPEQPIASSDLESARPQTVGEEELQLQLALAMSKEEADQEEAKRKSDDVRLQMALSQSEVDYNKDAVQDKDKSALRDLLDINFNPNGIAASSSMSAIQSQNNTLDPWGVPVGSSMAAGATSSGSVSPQNVSTSAVQPKNDPWSSPASAPSSRVTSPPTTNDPWAPKPKSPEPPVLDDPWAPKPISDPWNAVNAADSEASHPIEVDPFAPIVSENVDEFSLISSREKNSANSDDDTFRMDDLRQTLSSQNGLSKSRSPTTFLGENSNLVNLDNLVSVRSNSVGMGGTSSPSYQNMNSLNNNNNNSHLNGFSFASDLEYRTDTPEITFNYNNNNNNNNNSNNNSSNNPFLTQSTISPAAHAPSLVPGVNPFNNAPSPPNPFQAQQIPKPSLNEMRTQVIPTPMVSNTPWGPAHTTPTTLDHENTSPFML